MQVDRVSKLQEELDRLNLELETQRIRQETISIESPERPVEKKTEKKMPQAAVTAPVPTRHTIQKPLGLGFFVLIVAIMLGLLFVRFGPTGYAVLNQSAESGVDVISGAAIEDVGSAEGDAAEQIILDMQTEDLTPETEELLAAMQENETEQEEAAVNETENDQTEQPEPEEPVIETNITEMPVNITANLTVNMTSNISLNLTTNLTLNLTTNITANTTANLTANITANLTSNITLGVNVSALGNETDILVQGEAEILKPVNWSRRLLVNESGAVAVVVQLPSQAENIEVKELEEEGTEAEEIWQEMTEEKETGRGRWREVENERYKIRKAGSQDDIHTNISDQTQQSSGSLDEPTPAITGFSVAGPGFDDQRPGLLTRLLRWLGSWLGYTGMATYGEEGIRLLSPNPVGLYENPVLFAYNTSQGYDLCELYVDSQFKDSQYPATGMNIFTLSGLSEGAHSWHMQCTLNGTTSVSGEVGFEIMQALELPQANITEVEELIADITGEPVSGPEGEYDYIILNITANVTSAPKVYQVTYTTPGPQNAESWITGRIKQIVVYSDLHYENVKTTTRVGDVPESWVKLYSLDDGVRQRAEVDEYVDLQGDGFVDRIWWTVPHLSNQTYEMEIAEPYNESRQVNLSYAEKEVKDVKMNITAELSRLEGNFTTVREGMLYVEFEEALKTNDTVSIYARAQNRKEIVLIDAASGNVVSRLSTNMKDWQSYNFTIKGLDQGSDRFYVDTKTKMNYDYVTGYDKRLVLPARVIGVGSNITIKLAKNESIDLTLEAQTEPQEVLVEEDNGEMVAEFEIFFENANGEVDLTGLVAESDPVEKKAVIHMDDWPTYISAVKTLYIPSTGKGSVYLCPNATSLAGVHKGCEGMYQLGVGQSVNNVSVTVVDKNGTIYYRVTGLEGTGGGESIEVLNLHSYPPLGGNWTVMFNTTGTANLTISPINGTTWSEFLSDSMNTTDDLEFLSLMCGNTSLVSELILIDSNGTEYNYTGLSLNDSVEGKSLRVKDYTCTDTGYLTNKELSVGEHVLFFEYGGANATAYNYVSKLYCEVTTSCSYTDVFHMNKTFNSHAELRNQSDYGYSVCCHEISGQALDANCSGSNSLEIIKLSNLSNAHVENGTLSNYQHSVCLNTSGDYDVTCSWVDTANCELSGYDTCMASVSVTESGSTYTNLHVGDCYTDPYDYKICCGTSGVSQPTAAPTSIGVRIESSSLGNYSNENLTAVSTSEDELGGYTYNLTTWYADGESIMATYMPFEDWKNVTFRKPVTDEVGAWYLDGDAEDETGNNDGTVYGATSMAGVSNQGYYFDGNDYILTNLYVNQTSSANEATMCAWARPTFAPIAAYKALLSTDNGAYDWMLTTYNGNWYIAYGTNYWNTGVAYNQNAWQHLCVVFGNPSTTFYINGTLQSGSQATGYEASVNYFTIGRNPSYSEYWTGDIDEVHVFDRALSAEEIRQVMWGNYSKDYTNNSNHGMISGAQFQPGGGYDGFGAYKFDGTNDYIQVPDAFYSEGATTLSAWVYPTSFSNTNPKLVLSKRGATGNEWWFGLTGSPAQVFFAAWAGPTTVRNVYSGTVLSLNTWQHIAAVETPTHTKLYINGEYVSSTAKTGIMTDTTTKITIGKCSYDSTCPSEASRYFNGSIDEVRMYDRVLTDEQIKTLYEGELDKIHHLETRTGEEWVTCVTPNDGNQDGAQNCSAPMTILEGGVTEATLTSSSGTNYSNEDLSVSWSTNFTDESNIYNVTNWFVDGESITALNMPFEGLPNRHSVIDEERTVGAWWFEGDATDATGHGNDGVVTNGAVNTSGKVGGGFLFDGTDERVNITSTSDLNLNGDFTIGFWYKHSSAEDGSYPGVLDKGNWKTVGQGWGFYRGSSGGSMQFIRDNVNDWWGLNSANQTGFRHYMITYNGSHNVRYLNGEPVGSRAITYTTISNSDDLVIGQSPDNLDGDFTIDELIILNKSLSAKEARELFEDGLSAHTDVKDYSNNSNHAVSSVNATWNRTGGYDGEGAYTFRDSPFNDYINISDSDELSFGNSYTDYPFSIEAWVLPEENDKLVIASKCDNAALCEYKLQLDDSNRLMVVLVDASGGVAYLGALDDSAFTPYLGKWTHVVATYDGTGDPFGIALYINAERVDSTHMSAGSYVAMENTDSSLLIGYDDKEGVGTNASIDSVRIYNRELTPEQVEMLYENKTDQIHHLETLSDEEWMACITPNDGNEDGQTGCSRPLVVKKISAMDATLDSEPAGNLSNANITATWDYDSTVKSNIKNITNWYVDGQSMANINMPFEGLPNRHTPIGTAAIWQFEGNAEDSTPNNNDGVLYGDVSLTTGKQGSGYAFDGDGDYINVSHSDSLNLQTGIAISAWVKSNADGYVVAKDPSTIVYNFTNCGQTGRTGPLQAACTSAYSGTTLDGDVTINTAGIQEWSVPATGTYKIEAWGAASGAGTYSGTATTGKGAYMSGEFSLTSTETLYVAVGQKGGDATGASYNGPGGGGGSFVVYNSNPLIVAGGGGASGAYSGYLTGATQYGQGAVTTNTGGSSYRGGAGGSGGLGGTTTTLYTYSAASGAGYSGDGVSGGGAPGSAGTGGLSYSNGLTGGAKATSFTSQSGDGGFGGGGGGTPVAGAGGGGYSGGAGSAFTA
ncbi:TPA: LamG domain-containing protein, partial [Candidatus Woesearchaeota archaeon]|nr:LamG domain-containing protein [Candidatus Woesearchaeota archaeon]